MSKKKQVKRKKAYTITAAEGCTMPLHRSVIVIDGARPRVITPETVITVAESIYVRRRIASGDFVEVDTLVVEHEDLLEPPKTKRSKKES